MRHGDTINFIKVVFMSQSTGRESDKFMLRFPEGMRDRLKDEAAKSGRSMNAEIVQRLELALTEDLWERERFVNLLNYKQHTIEKMMHMLSDDIGRQRAFQNEAKYERALRTATQQTLFALCQAIVDNKDAPDALTALAQQIAGNQAVPDIEDIAHDDRQDLARQIQDRDNVEAGWEDRLPESDKEILKESRRWSAPEK